MLNAFELQQKLVAAAMPSGHERRCGDVIAELARPFCDEMWYTPTGSLVCHKKGDGKRLMFAAHMDVIGFIVTYVSDEGYVSFTNIGGHNPAALVNTKVVFVNGVRGIIRLRKQPDKVGAPATAVTLRDLYIDIAATNRAEAEAMVNVGDLAMFDTVPQQIGDHCMMSPYCDDLAACCVQLMAMEQTGASKNDLYFVFTVQEELGLKGAITATNCIEPYMGIAIDLCYSGDEPAADMEMPVRVGGGPTVKIKDASVMCSPAVVKHMRAVAEQNDIPYQNEIIIAGGTDTAAMMHNAKGALAGCMSLPGRNIHSPCEIVSLSDMENGARLIAACAMAEL